MPATPQIVDVVTIFANALLLTRGRAENTETPGRKAQFETFVVLEFPSENSADIWQREAAPALPAGLTTMRFLPPLVVERGDLEQVVAAVRGVLSRELRDA